MTRPDRWTPEDDEHLARQARAEALTDEIARITGMPRSGFTVHVPRPVRLRWWQPGRALVVMAVLLILAVSNLIAGAAHGAWTCTAIGALLMAETRVPPARLDRHPARDEARRPVTTLDLSTVVDHVARGHYERVNPMAAILPWDDLPAITRHLDREAVLPLLADAAPLIEASVREAVAQEIEAQIPQRLELRTPAMTWAMDVAAGIARDTKAGDPR